MTWQYTTYLFPLLLIVVLSAVIGVLFWRRNLPATRVGALMMFAGAEWVLALALELHAVEIGPKILWNQLQYVGVATLLNALTVMTLLIMGDYRWVGKGKWVYWAIPPVLGTVLVLTNPLHGWVWPYHELQVVDGIVLLDHPHGLGYYLFYVYGFVVITGAIVLGLRMLGSRVHLYRRQALLLLAALGIPYAGALLELVLGTTLLPYISIMPVAFVVGATLYTLAVLYLRAGDLVPVARDVVVDIIDAALIVLDLRHRVVDCNVAAQQLMGRTVRDCLGQSLTALWPEGALALLPLAAEGLQGDAADDVMISLDGSLHHFNVRVLPVDDWRGMTGIQVIILRDITQSKQAELALMQSEARFRNLAESMPDNILLVDMRSREIVYTNRPAFMGAQIQGKFGKIENVYRAVHPEDRARVIAAFERFSAGEMGPTLHLEYRIIPPSAEQDIAWVEDRETILTYDESGLPHEIMVALSDITARKLADDQRLDLTLNQERVRLLADFVRSVAHEFRTPLAVINTQLYLLQKRHLAASTPEELTLVKTQLSYIHKLLDDMLTLMRLDSETAPLVESFDLNELLYRIHDQFKPQCMEGGITVQFDLAADLPLCNLPIDFPRAVENLMANAIVYTNPGGMITLASSVVADHAVLSVADTGVGMRSEDIPHIFERFYRVDQARTARQVGLGLPMAQRIVDMAGGRIEVSSVYDKGSTFSIYLPLVTDAEGVRQ